MMGDRDKQHAHAQPAFAPHLWKHRRHASTLTHAGHSMGARSGQSSRRADARRLAKVTCEGG